MSGGKYNYFYRDLANFIEEHEAEIVGKNHSEANTRARKVFMDHLKLVQECLEQIELVDSSDIAPDDDLDTIIKRMLQRIILSEWHDNVTYPLRQMLNTYDKEAEYLKLLSKSESHIEAVRVQLSQLHLEIAKIQDLFEG